MGGGGGVEYSVEYYTQVVDHFSFRNESTFQQRYLIHKDYWTGAASKGPIFLYCGNEGDIEWFAANTGFLWDIAPVYGALILFPEVGRHRMLNFTKVLRFGFAFIWKPQQGKNYALVFFVTF